MKLYLWDFLIIRNPRNMAYFNPMAVRSSGLFTNLIFSFSPTRSPHILLKYNQPIQLWIIYLGLKSFKPVEDRNSRLVAVTTITACHLFTALSWIMWLDRASFPVMGSPNQQDV